MYAIITTGGKQLKAVVGETLFIEKLDAKVDDEVTFDKVLYVEGEKVVVGKPYIEGAIVKGKVVKNGLKDKIHVLRYKAKSNLRVRRGHRQPYTAVTIEAISLA